MSPRPCGPTWPLMADRNLRVTLAYLQKVVEPDRRKGELPFFLRQDGDLVACRAAAR